MEDNLINTNLPISEVKKTKTCGQCNYTWIPTKEKVKACPRCKRYFYYDDETKKSDTVNKEPK